VVHLHRLKLASKVCQWYFALSPPRFLRDHPGKPSLARRRQSGYRFYLKKENKNTMADKTLTCRDCGTTFTFTEGEQDFYTQKGYSEPTRCPDCRAAKKAARQSGGYGDSYGGSSSYGSYGGSRGYSGGGGGGGYGRSERTMTQVVCANCGKDTEVPFVPRGDKPVYCSDCYSQMNGGSSRGGGRSRY
jgi:CxxC-x17-CxxC domain-containing protein